ncbi:MAG: LemA family protein [Desulfobacterales bacterium]|nr:LemA family protein [Desulfobacterales bacterium]
MESDNNYITRIIQSAYGRRYNLDYYNITSKTNYYYLSKIKPILNAVKQRWVYITLTISVILILIGAIYYYNSLVITEKNTLAAKAHIEAQLQRRNDLATNLVKIVLDHSHYERDVITNIIKLRTTPPKEIPHIDKALPLPDKLNPLTQLFAIAEQYPDLKLSSNFQSLMSALIEVEKDLSLQRIKYNDVLNIYTITLSQFPSNVYAKIFGFYAPKTFEATDEAKKFKSLDF